MHVHLNSIWINERGQVDSLGSIRGKRTPEDRVFALDTIGWVNICAMPHHVEVWSNPRSVTPLALGGTAQILEEFRDRDPNRVLILEVHDGGPRGSLPFDDLFDLFRLQEKSLWFTTNPGHPLVHRRGQEEDAWDLCDTDGRDLLHFALAATPSLNKRLVNRVEASPGRAKIVFTTATGTVQYLCHDQSTQAYWEQRGRFVGRFLRDLPVPNPIKRSLHADSVAVFRERRITVSVISGLRNVVSRGGSTPDTYARILVPLTPIANSDELPVLVLLSEVRR